jgi:hypothetical protein
VNKYGIIKILIEEQGYTVIEELLSKRKQINVFNNNIFPEKELINFLLEKTFNLVPSKQNLMPYEVLVLGPDKLEEKKKLYNLASNMHSEDSEFTNTQSNHQLHAPYVLLFVRRYALPNARVLQYITKGHSYMACDFHRYEKDTMVPIEIGMFMLTLSGLCMENNIDVSYTGCLPSKKDLYKDFSFINENVCIAMSLGYEKLYKKYPGDDKPNISEVITWI